MRRITRLSPTAWSCLFAGFLFAVGCTPLPLSHERDADRGVDRPASKVPASRDADTVSRDRNDKAPAKLTSRDRDRDAEALAPAKDASPSRDKPIAKPGGLRDVYFAFWNVENLFDDVDDPKNHDDLEDWYPRQPEFFKMKIDHLADAIMMMNGGDGPDILCMVEVENEHCVEVLRQELNRRLSKEGKSKLLYNDIVFKEDITGRRFAPAMLTRLPVVKDKTQKLGKGGFRRILEGHIVVDGQELVVITAHWTSRMRDGTDDNRRAYADSCYGRFRAIATENPDADVIVCGDFNDGFKDESLQKGLHASDSIDAVIKGRTGSDLKLFDLCARYDGTGPSKGTIFGRGKWSTFDHICLSRGLFDNKGWSCDPKTTEIFNPPELRNTGKGGKGEPFRFGNEKTPGERGYSDHFPVTAILEVGSK